jgi:hypothetical protein
LACPSIFCRAVCRTPISRFATFSSLWVAHMCSSICTPASLIALSTETSPEVCAPFPATISARSSMLNVCLSARAGATQRASQSERETRKRREGRGEGRPLTLALRCRLWGRLGLAWRRTEREVQLTHLRGQKLRRGVVPCVRHHAQHVVERHLRAVVPARLRVPRRLVLEIRAQPTSHATWY